MIHQSADVAAGAKIGNNVEVWSFSKVRDRVSIGDNTLIHNYVFIDKNVVIGKNCKIQNRVSIYHGVTIGDGVFIGPHVCFTNDKIPRAVNKDGSLKDASKWKVSPINVGDGASIGANSTILPGVSIGKFALVGAGSVVTKDVPDYGLVIGNPARLIGKVDEEGNRV